MILELSIIPYASDGISFLNLRFENDVKMYGTQTRHLSVPVTGLFENDVKMYGTQTLVPRMTALLLFENDVKMYGTQTKEGIAIYNLCLRMM